MPRLTTSLLVLINMLAWEFSPQTTTPKENAMKSTEEFFAHPAFMITQKIRISSATNALPEMSTSPGCSSFSWL